MGTLRCGRFGISSSISRCCASNRFTSSFNRVISSPILRTRFSCWRESSPFIRIAPISLLSFLRSALRACNAVSALRRSASTRSNSSILASSSLPRSASRLLTISGWSRMILISNTAAIVEVRSGPSNRHPRTSRWVEGLSRQAHFRSG